MLAGGCVKYSVRSYPRSLAIMGLVFGLKDWGMLGEFAMEFA
uniref:Uncharacterized protein n=1 Tax=Candidatus Kentrum sp. LPFa TaxID=2126335 RepID=A0A450XZF0_9GAMM|nr:MAG: hypothetical protein BECKLPF1236A_GA0070988_102584 [Candidatus Kentron sp. LPFa]VFK34679.1 MAG: hypothetical protein BECKLPF1236C_GA0070990_102904 [Candidatus Kentron sp. LPFa]